MPRVSHIQYNPNLTVKQNAKNNGVSDAAIRYHIKTHFIDRRFERKQCIIDTCRKYLKKKPNASLNELHRETKFSLSTIRQYKEFIYSDTPLLDFDKNKYQKQRDNYWDILSQIPVDEIRFYLDSVDRKKQQTKKPSRNVEELKSLIDKLKAVEQENSKSLQCLPSPTLAELTIWEEYDASKYLCYAFRKKGDKRKGKELLDLGNMCGGYGYDMHGVHFKNSEAAYICGMFSDDSPEHIEIQQELIKEGSGFNAKKFIRMPNEDKARKDWNDFNQQWMLYVVWQKVQGNEEFRDLLMAIPEGATIIEDSSLLNGSTATFWGTKNNERKDFYNVVKKYIEATQPDATEKTQETFLLGEFNNFTDYGTFRGKNVMGKILMICKKCLQDGTEPDIDYDLLKSKHIHLLGEEVDFEKRNRSPRKKSTKGLPHPDILLGTIAGDMIGKPYERRKNSIKTTDFPLFEKRCKYTDDTVLTIAVMDWLLSDKKHTWAILADRFVHYGTRYRIKGQDRCFSNGFVKWLFDENREYGRVASSNGAAMRVSPVGWYFNTIEEVEEVAKIQASLTHNHPDAIQGAQVAAVSVLLARQGKSKEDIQSFIEERYGWNLHVDLDEFRKDYEWTMDCKETVRSALVSFLNSHDFEGTIRNAVSLGGDADTIGAIAGSIAEAFYGGVPEDIKKEVLRRSIPDEFKDVLLRFSSAIEK